MGSQVEKVQLLKPYTKDLLSYLGCSCSRENGLYQCPICGSGTGKNHSGALSIYEKGTGKWKCHSCGRAGDIVDLACAVWNVDWKEAVTKLSDMFLGGMDFAPVYTPKPQPKPTPRSCIADVDKRNRFYTTLLGQLTLSDFHRNCLIKRGVPVPELWRYRSVPDDMYTNHTRQRLVDITAVCINALGELPNGVPGFYVNSNGEWTVAFPCQGFLIPVLDLSGRIQGMQCRADNPAKGKYKWVSSNPDPSRKHPFTNGTCAESAIHCHLTPGRTDTLYITEGPLKGDIAAFLLNRSFIAIPGVSALNMLPNVLKGMKKLGYVRVVCALDMDRMTNNNVAEAVQKIAQKVVDAGMGWHDWYWNPNFAADGLYKGVDDWALARTLNQIK